MKRKKALIYAISGYKNSGKTTLITRLIPELTKRGLKVAVIKHDGHDFEPDVPGTDSFRHRQAGAYGTAVFSGRRFMLTKEFTPSSESAAAGKSKTDPAGSDSTGSDSTGSNPSGCGEIPAVDERDLIRAFPEADIILIEGLKNSPYPKYFCAYPDRPLIDASELADRIMEQRLL